MALFADRAHAGRDLAGSLERWRGTDAVVVGIARGGVVVADVVADTLALPLTAIAVRKLGVPGHEEVALGAIAAGVRVVDARAASRSGVDDEQLAVIEARERETLMRRQRLIPDAAVDVRGRTVLLIDDGVATGATANAAARGIRTARPGRVVLAVPVAPAEWRPDTDAVDEFVCPHPIERLWAVGAHYDDFTQTADEDVATILARGR